jgi:hypothetical protein
VRVLEQLYLIQRVQPGFRNELSRLERVASAAGSAFMQGIVLSDGVQTLLSADNLRAVSLSALWA